jgi:DNA polymerase III subunit epsilon
MLVYLSISHSLRTRIHFSNIQGLAMEPNILFFDLETSGLDPKRHGIIQAAWIVEAQGEIIAEKSFDVALLPEDDVTPKALSINKFTLERITKGHNLVFVLNALKVDTSGFVPVIPCGHNVQFDISFLIEAGRKTGTFLGSIDFHKTIDTLSVYRWLDFVNKHNFQNHKLETLCEYYHIPLKAHDALEDVRAVRKLFHLMKP